MQVQRATEKGLVEKVGVDFLLVSHSKFICKWKTLSNL